MPTIKTLPTSLIELIAAGEVIERPASIVKELVDNALDAGATTITVQVERGGISTIRVTDNGLGMAGEELPASVARYATSKISTAADLEKIRTLGFRGEALASICQMATVTIASRPTNQDVGHSLTVTHQRLGPVQPQAMPSGTTILVEDIFGTVPARRKFLKKPPVELKQIIEVVTQAAIAFPEVGFDLFHDQRLLLHLATGQSFEERVATILGPELSLALLPVASRHPTLSLKGYIGKPQVARRYTSKQFLTVNHRPVAARLIARTVKQLYGSLLEPKAEPIFILSLELSPELIDPNVHPRKELVAFMDEAVVIKGVREAIETTLVKNNLVYTFATPMTRDTRMLDSLAKTLKDIVAPWDIKNLEATSIMQIDKVFLAYATQNSFVLVDQHAAHERILYEQFKAAFLHQTSPTIRTLAQPLLIPLPPLANPNPTLLAQLRQIGFDLEIFGDHMLKCAGVPSWFTDQDAQASLATVLEDDEGESLVDTAEPFERTLAYLACKQAIKAGDSLTAAERHTLITRLHTTPNATTCPHGRPTTIVFSRQELDTMFMR